MRFFIPSPHVCEHACHAAHCDTWQCTAAGVVVVVVGGNVVVVWYPCSRRKIAGLWERAHALALDETFIDVASFTTRKKV